jgi:hypothetical protein
MKSENKAGRKVSHVYYVDTDCEKWRDMSVGVYFDKDAGRPWCIECNMLRRGYARPIDVVLSSDSGLTQLVGVSGVNVMQKRIVDMLRKHIPQLVVGEAIVEVGRSRSLQSFYVPTEHRVQFYGAGGLRSYTQCKKCNQRNMITLPCKYALRRELAGREISMTVDSYLIASPNGRDTLKKLVGKDVVFRRYPVHESLAPEDAKREPLIE